MKKGLSKRNKRIIILSTIGFALVYSLLNAKIYPFTKIEVSGNYVDNGYNNHLAGGKITRQGDDLYLIYPFNMLPIKLNNEGSRRYNYSGVKRFKGLNIFHLYSYSNDHILVFDEGGRTEDLRGYELDIDSYSLESLKGKSYMNYMEDDFYHVDEDTIVCLFCDEGYSKKLCIKKENSIPQVIDEVVRQFYYCDGDIYYVDGNNEICKYNIETETIVEGICFNGTSPFYGFLVHENNLVFFDTARGGILQLVIYDMERDEKAVIDLPGVIPFHQSVHLNAYDGKIYYSTPKGLFVYDIENQQQTTLKKGRIGSCYIFDDTWVYYEDYWGTIWRITQDGQNLEKVYGW